MGGKELLSIKEDGFHNISEQEMIQENQLVLIKFCFKQNEDMTWDFFWHQQQEESSTGMAGWGT